MIGEEKSKPVEIDGEDLDMAVGGAGLFQTDLKLSQEEEEKSPSLSKEGAQKSPGLSAEQAKKSR